MAGCRGSQRTTAARFSYEGSSPDCHRARRPHPGILRPLSFPVERPPQPPAGAAWVCPTRRPHTPTYADDGGFQSVIPAASAAWRRPRLPQWSWAAAWAIGHMRTTGRPWRAERACRRPPIWTGPPKSVGIRAGHYDRSLTAKAGRLGLKVPKLKGEVFESAVIERHRRREESVDPPLSRQVPAR